MADSNYWQNFWRKRLSRRRLLAGAALGGGALATATVIGCAGEEGAPGSPAAGKSPAAQPSPGAPSGFRDSDFKPHDARRPFIPAPAGMAGGTLRFTGFDALVFDTYDPHQTQFGPLYSGHSAVHSKILKYDSHEEQIRSTDLAESIPEVIGDPNAPTEFIIHLRKGVKFHDTPAIRSKFPTLAGRELTAEDVRWSFDRQRSETSPRRSLYYRSSQYKTMDKVEVIDNYTLRITTTQPIAPFLHFLADTNAFILAKEVVDQEKDTLDFPRSEPQGRMIGTGPFIWGELKSLQEFNCTRNPSWYGWDNPELGLPYLDGYRALFVVDDASIEVLFRDKKIDVGGFASNPKWVLDLKDDQPELEFLRQQVSGWVNSRLKVADADTGAPCVPWNDIRLRQAVHLAANRQDVVDVIWKGEARMVGPVGRAIAKWALPDEELLSIPGYRQGPERAEDLALARSLYEEAGSPQIQFTFADLPSYIPNFAPTFIEGLRANMGANIKDSLIRAYPQIAEGLLRGCDQVTAYWGFDNGWIDLDDWVYPYFHTDGPKNSFGVSDPELDRLLDAQRLEFDEPKRQQLGYQIQRYLLGMDPAGSGKPMTPPGPAAFSRLDYASLITAGISWPFFKNRLTWPWFGNNHWTATVWLDRNDPSFQGRVA